MNLQSQERFDEKTEMVTVSVCHYTELVRPIPVQPRGLLLSDCYNSCPSLPPSHPPGTASHLLTTPQTDLRASEDISTIWWPLANKPPSPVNGKQQAVPW